MNKRQTKKEIKIPALKTWPALNKTMMEADEATCRSLMAAELAGRKRKIFLRRIQSRINRLVSQAAMNDIDKVK